MTSESCGISGQNVGNVVPRTENHDDRYRHNVSMQTGEEFSEEFLRKSLTLRKANITTDVEQNQSVRGISNPSQNCHVVSKELHDLLGIKRSDSDSGAEFSDYSPRIAYAPEGEKKTYFDTTGRCNREYNVSGQQPSRFSDERSRDIIAPCTTGGDIHASESPHSHQNHNPEAGVSESCGNGKIRLLCSYGGRILPRPNDGKLRYVGGETRIISIRKNLTFNELVKKTTAICNQPHTIKYQLPEEDLDALVSVSSDEDLQHMIEEYHDLGKSSQRLRLFLVPCADSEGPCSFEGMTLQQTEADYQYVVAVNGMLEPGHRRSSSRETFANQASQFANALDCSPICQRDSPTYLPFENRNGGNSMNMKFLLRNPSSSYVNISQVPSTSYVQSSPLSPATFQIKDPNRSHVLMYDNVASVEFPDACSPYALEEPLYENSYHVDTTGYYYNCPLETTPRTNYPSKQSVSSSQFGQTELDSRRLMSNKREMHLEKLNHSQNIRMSPESDIQATSAFSMHQDATDQSRLVEGPNLSREESISSSPLDFLPEKSPSLAMSCSSQQWLTKEHEVRDENHPIAKKENQPNIEARERNQEYAEWSQSTTNWIKKACPPFNKCSRSSEVHASNISTVNGLEHELKLPKILCYSEPELSVYTSSSDPKIQVEKHTSSPPIPQKNSLVTSKQHHIDDDIIQITAPHTQACGGTKTAVPSISHEYSTNITGGRYVNYNLSPSAPGCLVKDQKESKHDHHVVATTMSNTTDSCRYYELQPSIIKDSNDLQNIQSVPFPSDECSFYLDWRNPLTGDLSIPNSAADVAYTHEVSFHQKLVDGPHKSEEKGSADRIAYEKAAYGNASFLHLQQSDDSYDRKLREIAVIVEDVTDSVPPDIPLSSTIVPHVQDEPSDGLPSAEEETDVENVLEESDYEDGKNGSNGTKESVSDSAIIEKEAGIYGLQIIRNSDLEELQELGSGTYGTVYYGKWRGTDVAIKRIKQSCFAGSSSEQERLIKEFWREAKILSKLHHPNIVALYGVVPDGPGGTVATVTEYMVNGSLRNVLARKDRSCRALDRRKKLMLALDAAFGMEYLHLKNIVHFDLKCENLLVNLGDPQRPVCKVGDFGLSRIKRNTLVSGGVRGTLPWMAPELLNGNSSRVSEKVDVFSFGITMWEILTGEEPYANLHCGAIIGGIVNNTLRPPVPQRCDPEWGKLMEECWSPDPEARPSFTEITNRLRVMSQALQPKTRVRT
ncbi:uncharacterized protein LOC129883231 [Solanum dulcamara]|uniref:uncharacterized protein LOC129883231 n=1 Tax=Solanum dulcamara TaxID=45834 RepID=UPI002485D20F|nr:uncharacterized protein LOC129883231 [Solanum dulcamara]